MTILTQQKALPDARLTIDPNSDQLADLQRSLHQCTFVYSRAEGLRLDVRDFNGERVRLHVEIETAPAEPLRYSIVVHARAAESATTALSLASFPLELVSLGDAPIEPAITPEGSAKFEGLVSSRTYFFLVAVGGEVVARKMPPSTQLHTRRNVDL